MQITTMPKNRWFSLPVILAIFVTIANTWLSILFAGAGDIDRSHSSSETCFSRLVETQRLLENALVEANNTQMQMVAEMDRNQLEISKLQQEIKQMKKGMDFHNAKQKEMIMVQRSKDSTVINDLAATSASFIQMKNDDDDDDTATSQEPQSMQTQKRRLEFVHIPKTGGTAVETAAKKHNISWGVFHYTGRPRKQWQYKRGGVPYWHMPPHYYNTAMNTQKVEESPFDPYGPSPYVNATLFTVVRNPYDRVVSEYHYYHQVVSSIKNSSKYNNVQQMNAWISDTMYKMAQQLQPASQNKSSSLLPSKEYYHTIDTAGHWNKTSKWTNAFIKQYFNCQGHLIPQYDYVFDNIDLPIPDDSHHHRDNGDEDQSRPPKPLIQHVLHFENLHEEFANLMAQYNLQHVVLENNPHHKQQQQSSTNNATRLLSTAADGSGSMNDPLRNNDKPRSLLVGVPNLMDSTKRLIEKVYARDFAAFGYEMMSN